MSKMTREERIERERRRYAIYGLEGTVDEQDRREGPLVEAARALRSACVRCARPADWEDALGAFDRALARYDALDAKPEPSVAEALEACEPLPGQLVEVNGQVCLLVPRAKWNAVMAAVEREKRCAGEGKR